MASERLAGGVDDLGGETISRVKARWKDGGRLGSVGHEMIGGLVGIGERIAVLETADDGEQLLDQGGETIGFLQGLVESAILESIDDLVEGSTEAVGGAQEETVVRAAAAREPFGVIALGTAEEAKVTALLFVLGDGIIAAAVLE